MPKKIMDGIWHLFNAIPEGPFKMRLRFFLAFQKGMPRAIRDRSPIRASIFDHVPQPGEVVVDAGAFPGDFTVFASRKVGPTGRVIAFEPHPRNFARMMSNVRAFHGENVTFIQKGLWSHDCTMTITGDGVDAHVAKEGGLTIELASLDAELKRLEVPRVDFIKMDIEGAEIRALEGAVQALAANRAHLAIGSYHEFEGEVTQPRVEKLLAAAGYKFKNDYPLRPNTYAWKE
jgi:FkbM family methyltransferase